MFLCSIGAQNTRCPRSITWIVHELAELGIRVQILARALIIEKASPFGEGVRKNLKLGGGVKPRPAVRMDGEYDVEKLQHLRQTDAGILGSAMRGLRQDAGALQALPPDFQPLQMPPLRAGRAVKEG